jgi:hypothetical protein
MESTLSDLNRMTLAEVNGGVLEVVRQEAVVSYFNDINQRLTGGTEENHEASEHIQAPNSKVLNFLTS